MGRNWFSSKYLLLQAHNLPTIYNLHTTTYKLQSTSYKLQLTSHYSQAYNSHVEVNSNCLFVNFTTVVKRFYTVGMTVLWTLILWLQLDTTKLTIIRPLETTGNVSTSVPRCMVWKKATLFHKSPKIKEFM